MKKVLNKWQVHTFWGLDVMYNHDFGWRRVEFAVLSFTGFPPGGAQVTRKNYKGFWLKFYIWLPFARARS